MSQTRAQLISSNVGSGASFAGIVTARGLGVDGDVRVYGTGNMNIAGVVTASLFSGPSQIGIQSDGLQIGTGITSINFVGAGNTFSVDGSKVTIGIRGSGVGIQSGGVLIGTGVTQFNFLGAGNTFAIVNDTVEVTVGGAGAGGGDFNSGISSSVRVELLGLGSTIFEAPAVPTGARYIVRSIMASNVATANTEVNVIGAIDYKGISGIGTTERSYFAYNVPISSGGAIEILPQPIILGPEDKILMRSTDYNRIGITSIVDVHIAIEQKDDVNYFGFGLGDTSLSTANQEKIVYTSSGKPTILQSIRACNKTNTGPHIISVYTQTEKLTHNIVSVAASTTNLDYYFTGSDRNGTLTDNTDTSFYINEGDIIKFDMTDTHSNHPLKLVNQFGDAGITSGVLSGAGTSVITWDTTGATPGTYRYECEVHTNDMRGFIYVGDQLSKDKPKYIIKNLIIPKYGVIELLDQPKRLEENERLGIGNSTGKTIDLQISGILATD